MEKSISTKKSSNISRVGRYRLSRTIGRGNFAIVKLGKHDVTKSKVAVKIIDKHSIDAESLRKVYREIQILKILVHPHVVRLYQVMESDSKLFIVTEYASGGELFEYLRKNNRMSEREARRVFRQIVAAVSYCHQLKIAHRDIKAENLLFSENNNIKLVDFGFSNYSAEHSLLQTWCGSPPYAAPELFLGEKYSGQKADIWSLGVVLYILVCGGFPFPSSSIERLRNAVLDGHICIPFYVSSECADLIRKMLVVNPKQRIGMKSIIQHRWFTACDWNDEMASLFDKGLKAEELPFEDGSINYACIAYMQQRGYSADKIVESIQQKAFNDECATYHLLCEKLKKKDSSCNTNSGSSPNPYANPEHHGGRRGSRGSITTGRVDLEPSLDTPLISTVDLAKLGMSSSSSSSEEEMRSCNESDSSNSSSPSASLQGYLAQRRHTALGVPAVGGLGLQLGGPAGSLYTQASALVPFPLEHCNILGEVSNLATNFPLCAYPPLKLGAAAPFADGPLTHKASFTIRSNSVSAYDFLATHPAAGLLPLVPTASPVPNPFLPSLVPAELLAAAAVAQQQQAAVLLAATNAVAEQNSLSSSPYVSIEEAGAHYLRSRSGTAAPKRHTIHNALLTGGGGGGGAACCCAPSSASPCVCGATSGGAARQYSPSSRAHRNEPYTTPAAGGGAGGGGQQRRVTDSSHFLTADTLRHLEKLYQNALQRPESPVENMRNLQQEFQQLRATTEMQQQQQPNLSSSPGHPVLHQAANSLNCSDIWRSSPRSSPPNPTLDMIVEQEPFDGAAGYPAAEDSDTMMAGTYFNNNSINRLNDSQFALAAANSNNLPAIRVSNENSTGGGKKRGAKKL